MSCVLGIYWFIWIRVDAEPERFSDNIENHLYDNCKSEKICRYGDKFLFVDGAESYVDVLYWVRVEGKVVNIQAYSYSPGNNTPRGFGYFYLRNLPGNIEDYKFKYTYTHNNSYDDTAYRYLEGDVLEIK